MTGPAESRSGGRARLKVMLVWGTRPETIKMAPVVHALRDAGITAVICLTAQHREMVDTLLPAFELTPDYDLAVMAEGQRPSQVAARVFARLPAVLREVEPGVLLVQGDTTTAMAAAVTSHYERIPVGHVEAGLRTGDLAQPFPEEANRKIVSAVASLHFAPTERAYCALLSEGVPPSRVHQTGNTVVDALRHLSRTHPMPGTDMEPRVLLVTAHRRESFGEPLRRICLAIRILIQRHPDIEIIYPVHPSPSVSRPVQDLLAHEPRVHLVEPLPYLDFIRALARCTLVLTDSGGVQEEAPVFGKPVLVLRERSERMEAVEAGCAIMVGTRISRIVGAASELLERPERYAAMSRPSSPFGDGRAAERIAEILQASGPAQVAPAN